MAFWRVLREPSRAHMINRRIIIFTKRDILPTNDERAERAREVLEMYAVQFGDPYDPRGTLIDVLTDLMHLAAQEPGVALEFDSSLKMAQFHFEAEAEECLDT
ncbi:MAG: hypothetical protein GDA68_21595 [Nitrospira sp. CR2.1]|nr:hypothetical protein [Nitrospira sp. CR2.1]MBA5873694.1 hypothetical protein [Nitrospira sp. CR1.2]